MVNPADLVVVVTTVDDPEKANALAQGLVLSRLAACVTQVPQAVSTYWWQGAMETQAEVVLWLKTRRALLPAIEAYFQEHHPYTVPECVALPMLGVSAAYGQWVWDQTQETVDSL